MAIFDQTIRGSGVRYGGATICLGGSNGVRTYAPYDRIITVIDSSGSAAYNVAPTGTTPYFQMLDGRYDTPPTGWNSIFN